MVARSPGNILGVRRWLRDAGPCIRDIRSCSTATFRITTPQSNTVCVGGVTRRLATRRSPYIIPRSVRVILSRAASQVSFHGWSHRTNHSRAICAFRKTYYVANNAIITANAQATNHIGLPRRASPGYRALGINDLRVIARKHRYIMP